MKFKPISSVFKFKGHWIVADFWIFNVDDDAASLLIDDLVQFVEEDEEE